MTYLEFLASQTTFTLATTNADNSPHACDLFYASGSDLSLYFLSDPKTQHIQNLLRDPRVSVTVHGQTQGWQDIRGIQIVGEAHTASGLADRAQGYRLYLAKYTFVGKWLPSVDMLGQAHAMLGVVELFKITPHWLRWIDNTQGFGHKEEVQVNR